MPDRPSILGMSLDVEDDDEIVTCQPVVGFVVVKALDGEGKIVYLAAATEGLKSVECLGMARFAVLKLEHGLTQAMEEEDDA
jgi:hypothetical protein